VLAYYFKGRRFKFTESNNFFLHCRISEWTLMSISKHFWYQNDVFQSDIFVSDIEITDVNVGCQISPTLRSMSMPTYAPEHQNVATIFILTSQASVTICWLVSWTFILFSAALFVRMAKICQWCSRFPDICTRWKYWCTHYFCRHSWRIQTLIVANSWEVFFWPLTRWGDREIFSDFLGDHSL
jgi:hypothetical protein